MLRISWERSGDMMLIFVYEDKITVCDLVNLYSFIYSNELHFSWYNLLCLCRQIRTTVALHADDPPFKART